MSRRLSNGTSTRLEDDHAVRLEDYVNDQLQTYADLEGLDALLSNVKTQQELLRQQLQEAEASARDSTQQATQHIEELRNSTKDFQAKQEAIDRRLLILTQSDAGDDAVRCLAPIMDRLQQLDVAQNYMDLLAEVETLSTQTRTKLKSTPKEVLEPYLRIKQISRSLKKAQPLADDAAPHLADHVEHEATSLWSQMKDSYGSEFETVLKKMKWPGKELTVEGKLAGEWTKGVSRLLELQVPHLLDDEPHAESVSQSRAKVLLPLEIMVKPLELRFKYHFDGDRPTNRPDKPEYFLSHAISLLSTYEEFLEEYLQPILTKQFKGTVLALDPLYADSVSAFISALLPMLRAKLSSTLQQISSQPQLFSHLVHELISFDNGLRDDWGYSGGDAGETWKGLTWEVLDKNGWNWFPQWLQIEKDFALSRYESIITQSDSGEIDFESVDSGITKPTKSAFRVNGLLETITDRYRELPSFYQKIQFLISIQISIFDKFHERLHSSLEAYLTMTSSVGRTVQGVSKEEQAQLQGLPGLDRLCRIYGSSEYLERKMQDWSEDVFFIELWDEIQYLNSTQAENGSSLGDSLTFDQVAERTSKGLGSDEDKGALFDETRGAYQRLRVRTEGVILTLLTQSLREALKPFGRATSWAASESGDTTAVSAELDSALEMLEKHMSFLARVLSDLALRRISRNLAGAAQTWIWDNVVSRHRFSAAGSAQLGRDVAALEGAFSRHTGARRSQPSMRKLAEVVELLNLPAKQAGGEEEEEEDAWEVKDENAEADKEQGLSIQDVERRVFHDNESAREVLEELGFDTLTESDARNILGKRIDLEA